MKGRKGVCVRGLNAILCIKEFPVKILKLPM